MGRSHLSVSSSTSCHRSRTTCSTVGGAPFVPPPPSSTARAKSRALGWGPRELRQDPSPAASLLVALLLGSHLCREHCPCCACRTRPVSSVAIAVDAAAVDLAQSHMGFNSSEEQHGGPLFIDSSSSFSFSSCAKASGQHISCLALISA
ncbi:hypothetical protein BDA96_07G101100 [Sorghum bicolor]|uniref:Uncharacterized protein n=4 Tax=Sorghum bicolor TaxID=4558 RepID=A0A921QJS3_SORBI|nr:hypothetical protein BDA96_07G101100 [Sorghum bicolor]OQU80213.1 hypothetical protein SORBI_3007G094801 [Sorghum bicolor]